jgi:RNA polymerase sigma-70 factor (ECF subfamily)
MQGSGERAVPRVTPREIAPLPAVEARGSAREQNPRSAAEGADAAIDTTPAEDLEAHLLMSDYDDERRASGTDLTPQASAARQDVPPFAEVFRTYSPFVWRVLLRLGVAEADIDDVAQEVFLGVHRNLPRFEGRCSLRTWVYGICHRRAVDYRRRASVRPELYSDDPPEQGVAASQEQGLVLSQARAQLALVLDGLDEEKRTVFVLFDIEGVPMDEVAEIVGCPLQTAYSRLYAARRKVEATLVRLRSDRRSV